MNTQVGKSVGIALLLAAGLLAALFAMGVFAPAGVDAEVRGTPRPTAVLSTNEPGAEDVTLTLTFELSAAVDGTTNGANVLITIPSTVTASVTADFDEDNISVTQGGRPVGGVDVSGANTISITEPAAGSSNERVEAGVLTTVVISDLTLVSAPAAGNVSIRQTDNSPRNVQIAAHASASSSPVQLDAVRYPAGHDKAGEVSGGDYEASSLVTMKLRFETDTDSPTGSAAPATDVVITLPMDYDLDDDNTATGDEDPDTDGTGIVEVTGGTLDTSDFSNNEIRVYGFDKGDTVTVTVTGLMNPDESEDYVVGFKQGTIPAAIVDDSGTDDVDETDPKYNDMEMFYITDDEQVAVEELELDKMRTGDTGVTMSFKFESVIDGSMDDVVVTLDDSFGGKPSITAMQEQDDGEEVEVGMGSCSGGVCTITKQTGSNAKNIAAESGAGREVMVEITGLTNPATDADLMKAVTVKQGGFAATSAGYTMFEAALVEQGVVPDELNAGADVQLTINGRADQAIRGGTDIDVTLSGFGIPDSIDEDDVIIYSNSYDGNPDSVSVSGSKVTIIVPVRTTKGQTGSATATTSIMGDYTILFKDSAGLTAPTSSGEKEITVTDADGDHESMVTINPAGSVDPTFVSRGDAATVTAKGLRDGTTTIHLVENGDRGAQLGSGTSDDGVAEIEIDTSDLMAGATTGTGSDDDKGVNALLIVDSADMEWFGDSLNLGIKPSMKLGSDSVDKFAMLEISVSDWYYGDINMVEIGGVDIAVDESVSDYKATFEVMVPGNVRTGEQEVKVHGDNTKLDTTSATASVTVGTPGLDVSPSSVVPGAQVTITGSDFDVRADVDSITIGGEDVTVPDDARSTSSGRVAVTVTVPVGVGDGDKAVKLTVGARTAQGEITVPEPSITVSPSESVPGSVVSVTGSGFNSGGRVEIMYEGAVEEVGRADSSGEFHIRLTIPSDAGVGETNTVKVESRSDEDINASADHKTPGSTLMIPEAAQVGTLVTFSGTNFEPFVLLDLSIGGVDVNPSPAPETDKNGAFEFEARVPRLAAGSHTVTVTDRSADQNSATETFTVTTTAVVSTPQEVFDVLGENLTVVWRYNNADQSWASYSPGAPAELNDLPGVSRGDIVWVELREAATFQGDNLIAGWSLVSLE